FRSRYGLTPAGLRRRRGGDVRADIVELKLAYRPPLDWARLLAFLTGRGAAGVELAQDGAYLRTVALGKHRGWLRARPLAGEHALRVEISASLLPVLTPVLARVRRLFDLDASPQVIEEQLARDARLRAIVRAQPGLRVPGAFDGFELALRAVLGQQVTVKAATTLFGRIAAAYGEPAQTPFAGLKFYSPDAARIAGAGVDAIARIGMPGKRAQTIVQLAREMQRGRLRFEDVALPAQTLERLRGIPGIGDWTANYIAMRALGHPDAWLHSDIGLMQALGSRKAKDILAAGEAWRPWRSYAALHLWASLSTTSGG
ncbi:MAG TPA: AlkA N-terminal domain-containing protein, partial [Nevskiaceae bacterium]|nr:AlkA N-terminal domain-containing protein [Nevskiaceae bacterium]